ncbi:lysophospholipid acyltransferase family protein [Chloracidobacterium aggregatum]|uniref:1-acyl-sn-glycerol-3-phosphate acyltransferase n=1 Tax=Chloracidobacterium sp. N TaxID=2821540 RepID=A0ABX8AXA2_9BACT|nr:lysophospholipid acyltransferase family protein [Chloracidobacterium aggregatum]QUV84653.1 1-acyl-sn-glycerol-3-phosphate acyltransferase [Chloracidobacterium sp. 2]QUV91841.1 1-acyl-sn-glycerol-3-phosphate acyltransferase [Chloracidobacterium sp. A]QUV92975.1 1-acyl-sn-glycerol-3-phosphate acyltransferase [Chloracidobacterium sp. N]QUV96129.1 1-acyl-sn-glycerol-3-phosphate acyltransferase [Chloracidobacterium sp. E]
MLWILKVIVHALFRVVFTLEYTGVEHVPLTGAVILAGNHPSYLDPVLISLPIRRRIRFVAWDKLFTIPLLGPLIRFFGAFPVDTTRRDQQAFVQALRVLQDGDALGIFPEAGLSKEARMNALLKSGAARLALAAPCPIVPVTIAGARAAWPRGQWLPLPRKITVKYHPPLHPPRVAADGLAEDRELAQALTEQLRKTIERRLLPALKVGAKRAELHRRPAWALRAYEYLPLWVCLTGLGLGGWSWALALPTLAYLGYVLLDIWVLPQQRLTKVLRDLALPVWLAAAYPWAVATFVAPELQARFLQAPAWILGLMIASLLFPFHWTSYYDTQRFLRGLSIGYLVLWWLEVIRPEGAGHGLQVLWLVFVIAYALVIRHRHWPFVVAGSATYLVLLWWFSPERWPVELLYYAGAGVAVSGYVYVVKFTAHDGRGA